MVSSLLTSLILYQLVVAGVQEVFEIVQAIVRGLGLGLGWRLGLETNHVPVCKTHEGH